MTALLSRVAKCMGWGRVFDAVMDGDKYICLRKNMKFDNTPIGHWLSHLLVEKMVGDGYDVHVDYYPKINNESPMFVAYAGNHGFEMIAASAPAAILALFVKVYSIGDENE